MDINVKVTGVERGYRDGMAVVSMREAGNGPNAISVRLELPNGRAREFVYDEAYEVTIFIKERP